VTPLVLEGILASTNISVSILIDSGASLDAVSHNFAREHGLTMLPLKQSSAAVLPNGATIALSHKCRIPLRLTSTLFTYVNAFVLRVIINTHLGAWRGVDDAPVYLLTGEETNLGSSL